MSCDFPRRRRQSQIPTFTHDTARFLLTHSKIPSLGCFGYPWSEPHCMTRPVSSAGSNSHTVAALNDGPQSRLRCGDGSGERNHSGARHLKPNRTSVRPPGSARIDLSWEITKSGLCALSGGLHHSTLDNDAEGDIFPERDQQLSRQRDDRRLPQAAALLDAFLEPQGERRLRLMTQP